ncbi:tyrosine-type recombinase/integrase [Fictibacillus macauensis]|uniref:tyrosine-type recombinase/integrase n=1 Tax=Fictibacillus macauensis TaxID=245160 RepID=UPI0002D5853F|nr:tyrosine-type recombinase/integrase [Fictibacillus macauensis]
MKKYLLFYQKKGNNATTTNSKLQRIRAFFNYMMECEVIEKNPVKKVQKAREDIKIDVFTDYHIKQMLNYYRRLKNREHAFHAYRDYTIIITLLGTGIRLSEMCSLKWSDINFERQTMSVFGKNRKKESIPVAEKCIKELSSYKFYCEQVFSRDYLNENVFTNKENHSLTSYAVQNVFKRLAKIMNFRDVGSEKVVKEYQKVNKKGKYDRLNIQILDKVNKYGLVAEYVYFDKGVVKSKLINPSSSFPIYDHENNLIAFVKG